MAKTIAGQFDAYLHTAQVLESTFRNGYLAGVYVENYTVDFMGHEVPNITQYSESLINDTKLVDSFTRDTGAIATLFAPLGDDFIRVSTSLKDPQGKRAVGTNSWTQPSWLPTLKERKTLLRTNQTIWRTLHYLLRTNQRR